MPTSGDCDIYGNVFEFCSDKLKSETSKTTAHARGGAAVLPVTFLIQKILVQLIFTPPSATRDFVWQSRRVLHELHEYTPISQLKIT